jgi:hypothetical protein
LSEGKIFRAMQGETKTTRRLSLDAH